VEVYNTVMATHPDVLVIGGGIIGLTSAYFLAKAGLSVEVLDKGDLGREASWAGAGIIPPGNPDRAATPIDKLRAIGSIRFPELTAELREATGIDNGYLRCGGIECLGPGDEYAAALWNAEGIRFERIGWGGVRDLEPEVVSQSETTPCLLPDMAQVRNPWHLRALIAACERVGVRLTRDTPVAGWELVHGRPAAAVTAAGVRKAAGRFLLASGAWAGQLLEPLGVKPGIRPVRGQIVLYRPERRLLSRVVTVGTRYLVPRADGRILVGSTEEPEAGFEKTNTVAGIDGLVNFATTVLSDLALARIETTWAGLRPGSPDGMPFIGPVSGSENVLVAAGHFRAGIQLSIGTAEMVRDLIVGTPPAVSADAFRLDRAPDLTARPAFRS
jgi:glycine oxidase